MTMHAFSSFNQAQAIADKYAPATKRTMYVVYEAPEFYVVTEEDPEHLLRRAIGQPAPLLHGGHQSARHIRRY
jgi:hypothetical protein